MDAGTYKKMAMGELTPQEIDQLIAANSKRRAGRTGRPDWLPKWVYVIGVGLFFVLFAPFTSSLRRES